MCSEPEGHKGLIWACIRVHDSMYRCVRNYDRTLDSILKQPDTTMRDLTAKLLRPFYYFSQR